MAAEPASLAAIVEPQTAHEEPWRWWWLAILFGSISGWGLVIFLTVLLEKLL